MEEQIVKTVKDKPHSHEVGKASNRHKIYYGEVEDLKAHLNGLIEAGLINKIDINEGGMK